MRRWLARLILPKTYKILSPAEQEQNKYPTLPPKMHLHRNPTRKPKQKEE